MKSRLLSLAITACALGAGCSYTEKAPVIPSEVEGSRPLEISPLTSFGRNDRVPEFIEADSFVVRELMADGQKPLPEEVVFECKTFRAGIVNHHALASDLLGAFFRTLKRCRPEVKTVIILSPDHFGRTSAAATVHELPYRIAGEEISIEKASVASLLEAVPSSRNDSGPFVREHGIGALIPFLRDEGWAIVPVIVRSQLTKADREAIGSWLVRELKQPSTFVAISSDMSHYLPTDMAWMKQAESDLALSKSDSEFFEQAKDDHADNGESIAAVIRVLGKTTWHPIKEAISSDYAGSPGYTTTYVIGFWE